MSTTHEDFRRTHHGRGPSDRNFAIVFTIASFVFGLWPLHRGREVRPVWLVLSGVLLLIAVLRPTLLHGANLLWTRLGILLGKVVNPIVTGLLFYLVFTPIALALRCLKKDLLGLGFQRSANSYWIHRSAEGSGAGMRDQF